MNLGLMSTNANGASVNAHHSNSQAEEGLRASTSLGVLFRRHRADDTAGRALKRIMRAGLICIDGIGLLPVASPGSGGRGRR